MKENELFKALAQAGLETRDSIDTWNDSSKLLSAIDAIARDGGSAVVKVDGGRNDGRVYTVVVSGGRLGDEFFRKDGSDLQVLLREAVAFWVRHAQSDSQDS